MSYTREDIAQALDLAVLKPDASCEDVYHAAWFVQHERIASLCVASCHIKLARRYTNRVCSVIGFPHGNTLPSVKLHEAVGAIGHGAKELDVVVNYGAFLCGYADFLQTELDLIVKLARKYDVTVKAILEICYYTDDQIRDACRLCVNAKVDYVKTSTGFGPGNATPEAVALMLETVKGKALVEASGGIKTYADAARYLDMGCMRIGSASLN